MTMRKDERRKGSSGESEPVFDTSGDFRRHASYVRTTTVDGLNTAPQDGTAFSAKCRQDPGLPRERGNTGNVGGTKIKQANARMTEEVRSAILQTISLIQAERAAGVVIRLD